MACRTGCPTQDHESWGECLRASNIQMNTGDANSSRTITKKANDTELALYREARKQGIQPDSTKTADIKKAIDISNKTGHAYGSKIKN